jgi:hypothetical protein
MSALMENGHADFDDNDYGGYASLQPITCKVQPLR